MIVASICYYIHERLLTYVPTAKNVTEAVDRLNEDYELVKPYEHNGVTLYGAGTVLTDEARKAKRRGRLYVDVARNGWAQTAISPYSVRPRAGAPVAMPITWDELGDPDLRPDGFTMATAPDRLATVGDPWEHMARHGRSLSSRAPKLQALLSGG